MNQFKVGDKVKHKYPTYEIGTIVRIDDSTINPYCILVEIDTPHRHVCCFKPEHLERLC